MAPKLYFKCSSLSLNCSTTRSNHTSELHGEEMQMNSFPKYIIDRKTVHKKYYRCNICIDTHTHCSQSTDINGSGDKSICMAKSSHSDHLQLPLTSVEDTGTLKTRVKTEMLLCLDEFLCFRSSKLHLKLFSLITHEITMSVILIFIALCYYNIVINKVICQPTVQNPTLYTNGISQFD